MGIITLINVALQVYRPRAGMDGFGRFVWGLVAVYVVLIWATYRRHIGALSQLDGQIEEKTSERLSTAAFFLAFSGYLLISFMLIVRH
jgi:hypothetical protein